VCDVTYEDGCVVKPNEIVTKQWSVKNTSGMPWPNGTFLQFIGGQILPSQPSRQSVPQAKSGETVTISVDVKIPNDSGRYRGYYRLSQPTTPPIPFGHNFWIEAIVSEPPKVIDKPKAIEPPTIGIVGAKSTQPPQSPQRSPPVKPTPKPSEQPKTAEPKPVEPKPVESKPVEPKPVEPKPVEPKPVESKPVESKPVEPKPVEPKPTEPPKPEKKEETYSGPCAHELNTIRKMGFDEPTELVLRLLSSAMQNRRARISPVDWVVHKLVEKQY